MHTKDKLAAALIEAGLPEMAAKATTGWYHDYLSPLATPDLQLAADLAAAGTPAALALRERHLAGEFEASREERDEWARSPEGRATMSVIGTPMNRAERRAAGERARPAESRRQRLGDAPIQDEYREKMNAIAGALDQTFNGDAKGADRETGFVLLVFPFGDADGGRCNFISNGADRKDVVTLMREMIARFEGQPEMKGHA